MLVATSFEASRYLYFLANFNGPLFQIPTTVAI